MSLLGPDDEPVEISPGGGDLRTTSVPLSDWLPSASLARSDRPISHAEIFATQTWVFICVMRLLTWSVRVPLKTYRQLDADGARKRLRPSDHPLAAAIRTPWERGSAAELVVSMLGPLLVHGNGLEDVQEGAGGRIRFDPTDWRFVLPIRSEDRRRIEGWKVADATGATRTRSVDTMLHLRWWSPLGPLGISPLQQLGTTIATERAAVEWGLQNLRNSARPGGVVELGGDVLGLEPEDRQELYDQAVGDMRDAFAGSWNAGKLPVMPPGFSWRPTPHTTAVEAALIEQRKVSRNEVAAGYQLAPPMVGILDDANYNNLQAAREMSYTDGLAPPLILIEQAINAHVCLGMLRESDLFVEFDFAGILRGDRLKEIQAIREAISSALLTPGEGRDILNMPRTGLHGEDKLYLPQNNLQPIDAPADEIAARRSRKRRPKAADTTEPS